MMKITYKIILEGLANCLILVYQFFIFMPIMIRHSVILTRTKSINHSISILKYNLGPKPNSVFAWEVTVPTMIHIKVDEYSNSNDLKGLLQFQFPSKLHKLVLTPFTNILRESIPFKVIHNMVTIITLQVGIRMGRVQASSWPALFKLLN